MKAKSLKSFRTKLFKDDLQTIMVNLGDEIEGDDEFFIELANNGLIEIIDSKVQEKKAVKATTKNK